MKLISLLTIGLTLSGALGAAPFGGAADLGNGNRQSAWFDYFNDAQAPWYYHFEHGWLYVPGGDDAGIWMWDTRLGWAWTSAEAYPYVYEPLAGWLYYARGSKQPRYFRDATTLEWLRDEPMPNEESYYPVPPSNRIFTWHYLVNNGQPINGVVDGVAMELTFREYKVTFSGIDLTRKSLLTASIGGQAYIEGSWYDLSGDLGMEATEFLDRNSLGIFTRRIETTAFMQLYLAGLEFLFNAEADASDFGELMLSFPWQEDLYEKPVGTVFYQELPSGRISGFGLFEVTGYPSESEFQPFDIPFSPLPSLRMEIVAKHAFYTVRGNPYNRVVELVVAETLPDPFNGGVLESEIRLWLAPGVGIIRSEEPHPVTEGSLTVELTNFLK